MGSMTSLPLAGRRVIELGTMVAAPFATHILSQLGAEVIKVEPPSGDTTRNLVRGGPSGKLIASADAFIHNLAPSAVRKLKISADDLAKVNPKLIYAHVRGYAAGPQE